MASNAYFDSFRPSQAQQPYHDTSYHGAGAIGGNPYSRTDAPLPAPPPLPPSKQDNSGYDAHSNKPSSPFDDNQYPAYPRPSQQDGGSGRQSPPYYGKPGNYPSPYSSNHDPFNDSNAIPLQNQSTHKLGGVGVLASPTSEMEQGKRFGSQRARPVKQGWFKGKITWACYVLFVIQVAVFIYEIARQATLTFQCPTSPPATYADTLERPPPLHSCFRGTSVDVPHSRQPTSPTRHGRQEPVARRRP